MLHCYNELAAERSHIRRLLNKAKRNNSSQHEYQKAMTEQGKSIRKAKWVCWKVCFSEIKSSSEASETENYSDKSNLSYRHRHTPFAIGQSYWRSTNDLTSTQNLLEGNSRPRATWKNQCLTRRVISVSKNKWVINKFRPFKPTEGGGIFPALLQKGPELLLHPLCDMFRAQIAFGFVPQA